MSPCLPVSPDQVVGAVMAGGQNSRYGALKALETVGGVRIVDRVISALRAVVPQVVMITNDPAGYASVGLPMRSDRIAGLGALGGIHSALHWASELGAQGILAAACDMPFIDARLLDLLLHDAHADVVVPESGGRRGIEPLCAFYRVGCLPAIEQAIQRGDQRMISFHDAVRVQRIPADVVAAVGDPAVLFMNVNTPAERARADSIAGGPA